MICSDELQPHHHCLLTQGHPLHVNYAQDWSKRSPPRLVFSEGTVLFLLWKKKSMIKLQNERTVQRICALDYNVCVASGGLTADARIVINRARVECQSHWLTGEDPIRYIASLKQSKHKQRTEAI